jgi:hypothetical protein
MKDGRKEGRGELGRVMFRVNRWFFGSGGVGMWRDRRDIVAPLKQGRGGRKGGWQDDRSIDRVAGENGHQKMGRKKGWTEGKAEVREGQKKGDLRDAFLGLGVFAHE